MMVQMASSNTLIQAMTPDRLRGRIMSVYSMMFMGLAPFGALSAGAVAHHLGAPLDGGVWEAWRASPAPLFSACTCPGFVREARELILEQGMMAGVPAQGATSRGLS